MWRDAAGRRTDSDVEAAKKCALEMAARRVGHYFAPLNRGVFVVSESDLDLWTTTSDAARDRAKEAIRSGGIVLPEGYGIEGTGRPTVVATEYRDNSGSDSDEATQVTGIKSAQLPAVEALPLTNATTILLSPEAAQALGVEARFTGAALTYEKFGWKDARANEEAISALGDRALVETEHAQENWGSWPWAFALALGALAFVIMILVIALSAPGQRRDASALHDVGAPPELAAHAAAIQAGATTLAGLLTGAVLGHLGAWVYTGRAEVTLAGDVLRRGLSDFLELSWQILFMSLVTAVAVAGVAWWVQRPRGAQRDDAAGAAREPAPHSLI